MALAYGNFHELSHQLRFLLFEIGIGLPQSSVDYYITLAHHKALKRMQHAAIMEGLINTPIASHHVHDFLDQVQTKLKYSLPESHFFQWDKFRDELDESIANDALAQAYKQCWNSQLKNNVSQYGNLWSWINNELNPHQTLLYLEQWGCLGHPYSPSFRAKMGFTRREVLQYSPEFQAKVSIHWCALSKKKSHIVEEHILYDALMAQQFPNEYQNWREKLIFNHINPHEFYPIPVHPWQWRTHLQTMCAQMIDNKSLILLPHHHSLIPYNNHDTLMPVHQNQSILQLTTSINSTIANNSDLIAYLKDVSIITNWLKSKLVQTNHYNETLFFTSNKSKIRVKDETVPSYNHHKLSFNLVQNPLSLLNVNQRAVPLPSLFSISPLTQTSLFGEIIKTSGLDPITYFSHYCHKILFGQLQLFLKHGVALEMQQDSSLIIFTDNKPQSLIIDNKVCIRISNHPLFNTIDKPDLSNDSPAFIDDLELIRNHFIQSTIQNNISHCIRILNKEFQLGTQQLWKIVSQVLQSICNDLSKDIDPRMISWQKHLLLNETWQHQCMLTMQLRANYNSKFYVKQKNLLINTMTVSR